MTTGQDLPRSHTRRQVFEWLWYGSSLVYCGVRVFLADRYMRQYGLDVRTFMIIEFASTIPYAFGSARMVGALADRRLRSAAPWALLASAGFLAPDLHTLITAESAPRWLVVVIVVWLFGAGALAIFQTTAAVRARRV